MRKYLLLTFLLALFCLAVAEQAAAGEGNLRFAITSAVASDPSFANYRELTNYIAEKIGRKALFVSGLSYNQVDNLFVHGLVDVGFLCNCHYARRNATVHFEVIAAPLIEGSVKPTFQVYLIVPKDSNLSSLSDLRGKSVDFADPLATTTVYAAYLLKEKHETINSFFGKTIYSGSHDMTIELVANNMVDAGFIDGHIWEYHNARDPIYSSKTKVILKSRDFTTPPVVVSRYTPEAVKEKIQTILLNMHEDAKGRELLKKLRIKKFIAIQEKDYRDVLKMYKRVETALSAK